MSASASPAAILGQERELGSPAASLRRPSTAGPELTIVVPTLNERDNVGPLIDRLYRLLLGVDWEAVFVDDDSADGTAEHLRDLGRGDRRIRCIRRFGRRGLSSACIEGILSSSARYIAVIDGDLQHDETLLPRMLDILKREQTDLVVASRYLASGAAGGLSSRRRVLSRSGVWLARLLLKSDITDPVSGFFMMRSEVADKAAARLSGVGTKILIDLLASAPRRLSVTELPYRFRGRYSGSSKLDWFTILEYLALLAEKVSGGYLPSKFLLFGAVGATGMVVHLVVLRLLLVAVGTGFVGAQSTATAAAMIWNYFLNNTLTYRDYRLVGWAALRGLVSFMTICGLGAVINVLVARDLYAMTQMWLFAGAGGAAVGALLNYALTSMFTWGRRSS
ncbi:MAG: glycosyltransferase family 2 protein [Alphaproteobacteria bacterium]|nr:glycosyltransferase family 2 protein [Alphaproteobacteria bacterium]